MSDVFEFGDSRATSETGIASDTEGFLTGLGVNRRRRTQVRDNNRDPHDFTARQEALKRAGLYNGPIDGNPNDEMRQAESRVVSQLGIDWDAYNQAPYGYINRFAESGDGSQPESADEVVLSPENNTYSRDTLRLQRALMDKRYIRGVGNINGVYREPTREAVVKWQEDNGYEPTGVVTRSQFEELLAN